MDENQLKKKLGILKKKLKKLKKISSKNPFEGLQIANDLKKEISTMKKFKKVQENEKTISNLNKSLEAVQIYIENTEKILTFKKKWEN